VINFLTDYKWLLRWNVEQNQYYRIVIGFDNRFSLFSTRIIHSVYEKIPLVKKLRQDSFRPVLNLVRNRQRK